MATSANVTTGCYSQWQANREEIHCNTRTVNQSSFGLPAILFVGAIVVTLVIPILCCMWHKSRRQVLVDENNNNSNSDDNDETDSSNHNQNHNHEPRLTKSQKSAIRRGVLETLLSAHTVDAQDLKFDPEAAAATEQAWGGVFGHECYICIDRFKEGQVVSTVKGCAHCFHRGCILQWAKKHSDCPVCRQPMWNPELYVKLEQDARKETILRVTSKQGPAKLNSQHQSNTMENAHSPDSAPMEMPISPSSTGYSSDDTRTESLASSTATHRMTQTEQTNNGSSPNTTSSDRPAEEVTNTNTTSSLTDTASRPATNLPMPGENQYVETELPALSTRRTSAAAPLQIQTMEPTDLARTPSLGREIPSGHHHEISDSDDARNDRFVDSV